MANLAWDKVAKGIPALALKALVGAIPFAYLAAVGLFHYARDAVASRAGAVRARGEHGTCQCHVLFVSSILGTIEFVMVKVVVVAEWTRLWGRF